MNAIPIVSANHQLQDYISELLKPALPEETDSVFLGDLESAIEFLHVEMPELVLVDFSEEQLDAFELMKKVTADSWLLQSGIMAIYRIWFSVVPDQQQVSCAGNPLK